MARDINSHNNYAPQITTNAATAWTWVSVEEGNIKSKEIMKILSRNKNKEQEDNPLDTLLHHD